MAFVAQPSPRMVNDIVYWYQFNTFSWTLNFTLTYPNNDEYTLQDTDVIDVVFKRNLDSAIVHEFTFTNFTSNSVTMNFSKEISEKFVRGQYLIGVTLNGNDITTLVPCGQIVVEGVVDNE